LDEEKKVAIFPAAFAGPRQGCHKVSF